MDAVDLRGAQAVLPDRQPLGADALSERERRLETGLAELLDEHGEPGLHPVGGMPGGHRVATHHLRVTDPEGQRIQPGPRHPLAHLPQGRPLERRDDPREVREAGDDLDHRRHRRGRLDLDVHLDTPLGEREHLREGRHALTASGIQRRQLRDGEPVDRAAPVGRAIDRVIVHHHRDAVGAERHVQLDAVGPVRDGRCERREGVLGPFDRGTPVCGDRESRRGEALGPGSIDRRHDISRRSRRRDARRPGHHARE